MARSANQTGMASNRASCHSWSSIKAALTTAAWRVGCEGAMRLRNAPQVADDPITVAMSEQQAMVLGESSWSCQTSSAFKRKTAIVKYKNIVEMTMIRADKKIGRLIVMKFAAM